MHVFKSQFAAKVTPTTSYQYLLWHSGMPHVWCSATEKEKHLCKLYFYILAVASHKMQVAAKIRIMCPVFFVIYSNVAYAKFEY